MLDTDNQRVAIVAMIASLAPIPRGLPSNASYRCRSARSFPRPEVRFSIEFQHWVSKAGRP